MKTTLTIFAALTALIVMSGCGSKSNNRDNPVAGAGTGVIGTNGVYAVCNGFNSSQARLGGKVQIYYTGNSIQEDKVRLRITTLDSSFDSSSNFSLRFYRWRVNDSSGAAELDQTPVTFYIENSSNQVISSALTSINTATVANMRNYAPGSGTSASEFFNRTSFQITGVDFEWDALKVVLYNGNSIVTEADMLLPAFLANPNSYATSHPGVLNAIHPFMANRSNGYTDAQWVQNSQNNCF